MTLSLLPKSPREFPDALQGGEGLEAPDHRIGETTRQDPLIDDVDPESDVTPSEDDPPAR